ncbi:hypothetical protein SISSUDRAFT_1037060 [Sistotremastrum suecicum HHB10207 ss-3]|uniref:Uncharacterized protein n=1 Tax=Sistotremastrum suecicum HHB10207 ss-3 TaxID=1314776 RepID=A0A165YMI1_9AGAM|nr:hypothetical protein SISSUDRAFT_1037060 [Sistotremastrum suecicum HHB10207 ss-3]
MPLHSFYNTSSPFRVRARLDPGVYDLYDFNKDVRKAVSALVWVMLRVLGEQGDARLDGSTRYPAAIFQRIVSFASAIDKDEWAKVQLQAYADGRGTEPPTPLFYSEVLMGVGQEWMDLHRVIKQMLFCRPVISDLINHVHTYRDDDTYAHLVGYWFSAEDWVVIAACNLVLDSMSNLYKLLANEEVTRGVTSTLLLISRTAYYVGSLHGRYRASWFAPVFFRLASLLRAWHLYTGPLDSLYASLFLHPGWGPGYLYSVWAEAGTPMATLHRRFVRIVLAQNDLDADLPNIQRVEWEILIYLRKLCGMPPYITTTKHDLWREYYGCNLPYLYTTFQALHMPMIARRAEGRRLSYEREHFPMFYAPSI